MTIINIMFMSNALTRCFCLRITNLPVGSRGVNNGFSTTTTKRFASYYITTPIFYVNSSPHIGHVHTLLMADALNIYNQLKQNTSDTILSTGTDEHGIKIQTAADIRNLEYKKFCDDNSNKFRLLFEQYDTTLTDFIRTTDDRHKECVAKVWNTLRERNLIYKSSYSGWYCSSDETFVPESQVTKKSVHGQDIHVDQDDKQVHWSSEENYMFRLSSFRDHILEWLSEVRPIMPLKFNDEAINLLKQTEMRDISVSRPLKRLHWGIRVPDDSEQTIYVWLDALSNYLTVAGYPCQTKYLRRWPVDCQVIGKDIIKFHALYWPSFLLGLGLSLPRRIICHSHWLIESSKISKSRGNVVDPNEENRSLTTEGLRYYLLRASTPHSDTDYSKTQATRRINAELADTYGNLMSRCCAPAINPNRVIPRRFIDGPNARAQEVIDNLSQLAQQCGDHFDSADFYKGVDKIMSLLRTVNGIYEDTKPWKLVKVMQSDQEAFREHTNLQVLTFEALRICSILLQPIVPKIASSALDLMRSSERSWKDAQISLNYGDLKLSQSSSDDKTHGTVLFRRIK